MVADPWAALAAGGLIYAGMLPLSRRSFHRLRAAAEGGDAADDEAKASFGSEDGHTH